MKMNKWLLIALMAVTFVAGEALVDFIIPAGRWRIETLWLTMSVGTKFVVLLFFGFISSNSNDVKMKRGLLIALLAVTFVGGWVREFGVHIKGILFPYSAIIDANKVVLSADIGGNVVEIPFKAGDVVKSLDVVCRIDNTDRVIASRNLELCEIRSTISGVITPLKEVGEYAKRGEAVASISDISKVCGYFYVHHDMFAHLKVGDKIRCFFIHNGTCEGQRIESGLSEPKNLSGTITRIITNPESQSKNVQTKEESVRSVCGVEVEFDNQDGRISPGMNVYTCLEIDLYTDLEKVGHV